MCYPNRAYYSPLLFQLLEEFEASNPLKRTKHRGHPKIHSDNSLIVFCAIMPLKAVIGSKPNTDGLWKPQIGCQCGSGLHIR